MTTRGELWSHAARFALLQRRMFRSSRSCDQSMQLSNIIARMAYMPSIYMRVGTNRDIWFTSTILPCPRFHAVIDCKSLVSMEGHITYVCRAACLFTKVIPMKKPSFAHYQCLLFYPQWLPVALRPTACNLTFVALILLAHPPPSPFASFIFYGHSVVRRTPQ